MYLSLGSSHTNSRISHTAKTENMLQQHEEEGKTDWERNTMYEKSLGNPLRISKYKIKNKQKL